MIILEKRNASSHCNYNDTLISYDQNRQPNGLRELLHIFEETRIPFEEQGYEETKQKIGNAKNVRLKTKSPGLKNPMLLFYLQKTYFNFCRRPFQIAIY